MSGEIKTEEINRLNIGKQKKSAVDEIQTSNLAQAEGHEREEAEEWKQSDEAQEEG